MIRGSRPAKIQEWSERLVRFHKSDLTVARFCQVEGVSAPSFYQWKSRLRDQLSAKSSQDRQPTSRAKHSARRSAFEAVHVNWSSQHSDELRQAELPAMTVRLANGAQLHVADNLPAIQCVLRELLGNRLASDTEKDSEAASC